MPFSLCNAPATFQAYIDRALRPLIDITVVVYLDDILIFSFTEADHPQHVKEVLDLLRKAKLYVKLSKCQFIVQTVEFLGFIISTQGIHMDLSRVAAIQEWPEPTTVKEVQSFLGFSNFYRRFIEGYSRVAKPLTDLTGKSCPKPFHLPIDAQKAFQALKDCFQQAPLLVHFNPDQPSVVETDASGCAISAILSQ